MNKIAQVGAFAPQTLAECVQYAELISKSGLVPKDFRGKPQDIVVAIQWGNELNLAPMQSLQNISVVNGRPSMWGDSLLALVRADSRCMGINETVDGDVATCTVKRLLADKSVEEITRTFSKAEAIKAKLWGRHTWEAYPQRMLAMRARGFALRDAFPDVLKGIITTEEANDYPSEKPKDVTPSSSGSPMLDKIDQAKQNPIVKEVQNQFPDAKITKIGNEIVDKWALTYESYKSISLDNLSNMDNSSRQKILGDWWKQSVELFKLATMGSELLRSEDAFQPLFEIVCKTSDKAKSYFETKHIEEIQPEMQRLTQTQTHEIEGVE